jgi:hypothetical protein
MKSKGNLIFRVIVLGVVLFFVCKIIIAFVENAKKIDEAASSTYILSLEDSILFPLKSMNKLKLIKKYQSKVRGPVSLFLFNKQYSIVTYQIDSLEILDLTRSLHTEVKDVERSSNISYRIIVNKELDFRFQYKAGILKNSSEIYLTLSGDSIKNVAQNDSIFNYNLLSNNISIRYQANDPIDIFLDNYGDESSNKRTPMNILFLRRNNHVYLLIMTPNEAKKMMPDDLLYNILMDR